MKKNLIVLVCLLVLLGAVGVAYAAVSVTGWIWSSNVGWISFNSQNLTPTDTTYKVSISTTTANPTHGKFTGYAWSSSVGWISFNQADVNGCPTDPLDTTDSAPIPAGGNACTPRVDLGTGRVNGWARALTFSTADSTTGWLHLSGTNHKTTDPNPDERGVTYTPSTGALTGMAWSPEIGWLQFNANGLGGGPPPPPPEAIAGTCTVDGGSETTIDPGTPVTLSLDQISGGSGTYTAYRWYDGTPGGGGEYFETSPPENSMSAFTYQTGQPSIPYSPNVTVSDDAGGSGQVSCGTVYIQSYEPVTSHLKLWVGSYDSDCLLSDDKPLCRTTFKRVNPNKPVRLSWDSSNTSECRGTVLSGPYADPVWSGRQFDPSGSQDLTLTQVGLYRFAIQCVMTEDGSNIPLQVTDETYNNLPIQNKVNVQVTNSRIEEI